MTQSKDYSEEFNLTQTGNYHETTGFQRWSQNCCTASLSENGELKCNFHMNISLCTYIEPYCVSACSVRSINDKLLQA